MEAKPRLIWISDTIAKGEHERRTSAALTDFQILRLSTSEATSELMEPRTTDTVVVDIDGHVQSESALAEKIRSQSAGACILVRSRNWNHSSPAHSAISRFGYLDAAEGPGLTRARIVKALANHRAQTVAIAAPAKEQPEWRKGLIGDSAAMQKVAEIIRLVGPRKCTVLITGETGTGKEVVARAIHAASARATGPFVALNCSAIPESLLESELFGHVRGAFTGAAQMRTGRFEQAAGGTLFLDEIGDMPLALQAKLLRVIQEREFQKLGSSETQKADVRILAATNGDLETKVAEGSFREDLFYRLNVIPLALPPLRDRVSDVRALATHFVAKVCGDEQVPLKALSLCAWAALESYEWPGNVRQLENALCSAVILSDDKNVLDEDDLALPVTRRNTLESATLRTMPLPDHGLDFTKTVNDIERNLLAQALHRTNGNKKAAAAMLHLKRTTLSAKVRVLELHTGAA